MTRAEAELFIIRELRLIDERRFDDWLALFAPDCLYWLPIVEGDPAVEPSLVYDDLQRLKERIFRITASPPAQEPGSRTLHNVSNVDVVEAGEGGVTVLCNLTVFELRPGDPIQVGLAVQRVFAANAEYHLVNGPGWRIQLRKVWLLNRDEPLYNLTFLF
ncbi:MAG TPA: aromatic-ring-hydroxylating dioxygenase subunit beta [Chloroflexota bacterium]|nr:aromatic-ring-hydroxylating dioxygenase subunit beta [Chloroflexota bacterium]